MDLRHAVITSVNRDERPDGGAPIFAMVIRRIRQLQPGCSIEVLIPDFKGSRAALAIVMEARPEILNHNVETVRRLFKKVQPQDQYEWAEATLHNARTLDPDVVTKSGIMVGRFALSGPSYDRLTAASNELMKRSWLESGSPLGRYRSWSEQ